jgi:amino acid permease
MMDLSLALRAYYQKGTLINNFLNSGSNVLEIMRLYRSVIFVFFLGIILILDRKRLLLKVSVLEVNVVPPYIALVLLQSLHIQRLHPKNIKNKNEKENGTERLLKK